MILLLLLGIVLGEEINDPLNTGVPEPRYNGANYGVQTSLQSTHPDFTGYVGHRCYYGPTAGLLEGDTSGAHSVDSTKLSPSGNEAEFTDSCLQHCATYQCSYVHVHYTNGVCYLFRATPCDTTGGPNVANTWCTETDPYDFVPYHKNNELPA